MAFSMSDEPRLPTGSLLAIDHLGIVVRSIRAARVFWADTLALEEVAAEVLPNARLSFLRLGPDTTIELIEPSGTDSPLSAWIREHGEGLHHIALRTGEIDTVLHDLRGLRCLNIDSSSQDGSRGTRIAFFEPGWGGAPIMELVQW
jgi:methylmalonyl-CoA epimerase